MRSLHAWSNMVQRSLDSFKLGSTNTIGTVLFESITSAQFSVLQMQTLQIHLTAQYTHALSYIHTCVT